MKNYNNQNFLKILSIFLIFSSIIFFIYGFLVGENSAGAGGLKGDFDNVWKTLQTFLNNDLMTSIKSSSTVGVSLEQPYISSRTPLIYIFNKLFNPFVESKINYIRSVFFFSLLAPVLFYYCLKIKFPKINNIVLALLACTILLSPYFRTSSYWGLEENYGIVFIFISYILLKIFFEEKKNKFFNKFIKLFFLIFTSSLCVYFDQKLLIIPLFCFLKIIFSNQNNSIKILTFLLYSFFSIPFLYLVFLWGNIIPTTVSSERNTGGFYLSHLGFTLTIIGFYFIPLFFFREKNIISIIKSYFKNNKNLLLLFFFIIYLFFSFFLDNYQGSLFPVLGKGVIHKLSLLLFNDLLIQKLFVYCSFVVFYFIVTMFLDNQNNENLIIFYFLISSIFVFPILQEYFDPLILIIVFIFFNIKLKINYKNVIFLFFYLLFFLIYAKIHYFKIFSSLS
jgi:hypothetical protein